MTAPRDFSGLQVALHWGIAGLIGVQLVFNRAVEADFDARMDGGTGQPGYGALLHVGVGLTILFLVLLRLAVRLARGAPEPPADNPRIILWLGMANHLALYALMLAMPLTGAIAWFGLREIAAELHEWGGVLMMVFVALHVLGALVEHFVFRQDTLSRMFGKALQAVPPSD